MVLMGMLIIPVISISLAYSAIITVHVPEEISGGLAVLLS
jgi:hypothetical protein